jgi:carboxymethylenebutenolidase
VLPPPPEARFVTLPGPGGSTLGGYLYVPDGDGPFPAVLWNHGSERYPGWQPDLARFYRRNGFAFFVPHRRGHGRSPGPYIMDQQQPLARNLFAPDRERRIVALHENALQDVASALAWLRAQPAIDPRRVVMSGVSFGGIQTVLAAEQGLDVRAFAAFAPAAMSWRWLPFLGARLRLAVQTSRAPLLVLQAANDFDLAPARELGDVLRRRGGVGGARVYPPFGHSAQDGHGRFACSDAGIARWGSDVLAFFHGALERPDARL